MPAVGMAVRKAVADTVAGIAVVAVAAVAAYRFVAVVAVVPHP